MFLFRKLSVPQSMAKRAHIIELVILSLVTQSCTAISGLSEKKDSLSRSRK